VGDTTWWSIADTGPDGPRACWFDDIYHVGGDGSFQNFQDGATWVETWQGALEDGCGVPVEPHDGSTAGAWSIDAAGANLRLDGVGSFLGVPKAVNGAELTAPAEAPAFVSYKVVELVGDNMTVRIDYGGGWWEYRLERVVTGSLISLALVRPKGTRPGGVLPTQVLTGRVPAGLTIFTRSVATAPSRMFRATKRGLKSGKALSRMVVTPRLHLMTAAITPSLSMTKKEQP
jgi:hypothetical protein